MLNLKATTLTHADNEVALGALLDFLEAAEQDHVDGSIAFVPAARYPALRTATSRARSSIALAGDPADGIQFCLCQLGQDKIVDPFRAFRRVHFPSRVP